MSDMGKPYDAIIVGARCAGSPLAMLLARKGYRVLLVDRATFPSDAISTHLVHPSGVSALKRWGLLERLVATGCPPIDTYAFDFELPFTIVGAPGGKDAPIAYCPRRIPLDKLLVDAAAEAGAEVREGFKVDELLTEDGRVVGIKGSSKQGGPIAERAAVVVGADGRNSVVADAVRTEKYNERPQLIAPYYTYWSDLQVGSRYEIYTRGNRAIATAPTHDGCTMVVVGWPYAEFGANKNDIEANYFRTLDLVPELAERVRAARCEARWAGIPTPNFFRKPHGPGWVLVGDAGYIKDPITATGISDAFRDAEACAFALDQVFTGERALDAAMSDYHFARDNGAMAMYDFTCQAAALQPLSPQMRQLLTAMRGNRPAMDGFAQMNSGAISRAEFLSSESIGAIVAAGGR